MPSLGETFRVTATLTDLNGDPLLAPDSQLVNLYEPDDTLHTSSAAPSSLGGGVFYQNFNTLPADPIGVWLVVWSATKDGVTGIMKKKIFIDDPPI